MMVTNGASKIIDLWKNLGFRNEFFLLDYLGSHQGQQHLPVLLGFRDNFWLKDTVVTLSLGFGMKTVYSMWQP